VLRGCHPARVDDKGRLKLPSAFRALVESQYGPELFVTSITGEHVRVYPMAVWLEIERRLAGLPTTHPARQRFLERVNFFGQVLTLDRQGRVVLPQVLREFAAMAGDVSVLGVGSHLEVWNEKRLRERFEQDPFTEADGRALADLGI
jgi:MraZ protein